MARQLIQSGKHFCREGFFPTLKRLNELLSRYEGEKLLKQRWKDRTKSKERWIDRHRQMAGERERERGTKSR